MRAPINDEASRKPSLSDDRSAQRHAGRSGRRIDADAN